MGWSIARASEGDNRQLPAGMGDLGAVDFFVDASVLQDPYPYYEYLRAQCPVQREDHHGSVFVTGYEETVDVYTDTSAFSSWNSMPGPFSGFPGAPEGVDDADTETIPMTRAVGCRRARDRREKRADL